MNINTQISIPDTLFLQKVDNETILLDIKTNEYFSLNEVGTKIWENLEIKKSLLEIKKELSNYFDVDENLFETDMLKFLSMLEEKEVIIVK